jgi:adenine-specific DNA-methyltransferase
MILNYKNKKPYEEILKNIKDIDLEFIEGNKYSENKLIYGENSKVIKKLLTNYKGKIDLIYIDPPFSTNNTFRIGDLRRNTISFLRDERVAYKDTLKGDEYLDFIRVRLLLLKELLSEKGSIYFHIDYKIGHYVKIIMDEIFGIKNFKNDITRVKCNPKNFNRKSYGNIKDMILFYTKSDEYIWNDIKEKYTEDEIKKLFHKKDKSGRYYTTIPLHAPGETKSGVTGDKWRGLFPPKGRHWRTSPVELEKLDKEGRIEWSKSGNPRKIIYADEKEGKKIQDIWEFKDRQKPLYPTEKNIDLIKRIILASSNKDSFVLDSFCGSGSTLVAAKELKRKWIGIDNSFEAINVAKRRLGEPNNLFSEDSYSIFFDDSLLNKTKL